MTYFNSCIFKVKVGYVVYFRFVCLFVYYFFAILQFIFETLRS